MHVHVDIGTKNVLIIGIPAAGKTYLSKLLAKDNPDHRLIHTDDYIKFGFKESLYKLLMDLGGINQPTIIEGMLGYRLLRKGLELDCYCPDMVIEVEISKALFHRTYECERLGKDIGAVNAFIKAQQKILLEYQTTYNSKPPEWIKLKNNY